MTETICLFCDNEPRTGRRLCDACLGLDAPAQIDAAANAIARILERPASGEVAEAVVLLSDAETAAGIAADLDGADPVAPDAEDWTGQHPEYADQDPLPAGTKRADPGKKEVIPCATCGHNFEKWKCQQVANCPDCRQRKKDARAKRNPKSAAKTRSKAKPAPRQKKRSAKHGPDPPAVPDQSPSRTVDAQPRDRPARRHCSMLSDQLTDEDRAIVKNVVNEIIAKRRD